MKALVTAKIGVFLVISSVLAAWTLLVAQSVQAHTTALPTPSCGGLPDDAFFTAPSTIGTDGTPTPPLDTARGTGTTTRERLHYAKIMIPALAAGELRVHSTTTPSDAVLCRGTSTRATSRTNYSAHNRATSAATDAANAADSAGSGGSVSSARRALHTAADALTVVANALTGQAATDATDAAGVARAFADDTTNTDAGNLEGPLDTAAGALTGAANALHAGFQIRAEVRPGDEEYVLVVAVTDAATVDPALAIQFHGAIESTALGHQDSFVAGQVRSRTIAITAPGLLTLEEKGSTDTMGTYAGDMIPSGGSDGNFSMVKPVLVNTTGLTLNVEGLTPTTAGAYTLDMDFKVAMQGVTATDITVPPAPTWTGTGIEADDTTLQIDGSVIGGGASADEDYFLFMPDATAGFLTIAATNATGASRHSNTAGTLYGPDGEIARDTDSGAGNHFSFRVPVDNMNYLVKVTGTTGQYALSFTPESATAQGTSFASDPATVVCQNDNNDDTNNVVNEICARGSRLQQERDRFLIDIVASGSLYVHTTGAIDTVGTLYGPDGQQIATDDDSGQGNNFSIAAQVNPGLHIVEVRGQNADTEGAYGLVTNFIAGEGPTTPTTPGTEDELQAEIDRLRAELAACEAPVETDTTGYFENPSDGGVRSGIGVISGWVCAAENVEVRIFSRGRLRRTLNVAYGTSRPDTVGQCGHSSPNTGFGMTYNFNHLDEGEYTISAYADDEQLPINIDGDMEATFEVVHLVDTFPDTNRFLTDLPEGECRAPDFPGLGETTLLKWEQSIQNFTIHNVLDQ